MIQFKNRLSLLIAVVLFPTLTLAQQTIKTIPPIDSAKTSHISLFRSIGVVDTTKSTVRVQVKEIGSNEPIQGATVLLRRDQDKMLGRVTKPDGRCNFTSEPATYAVRVQLTGYQSLEYPALVLESGHIYEMTIRLGRQ